MESKPTFKQALVISTATIPQRITDPNLSKNHLVVVTAAGIIFGDYVTESLEKELHNDLSFNLINTLRNTAAEISEGPQNCLLLKNVTLFNSSGLKFAFDYLNLFIDDIIGVSLGEIPSNN